MTSLVRHRTCESLDGFYRLHLQLTIKDHIVTNLSFRTHTMSCDVYFRLSMTKRPTLSTSFFYAQLHTQNVLTQEIFSMVSCRSCFYFILKYIELRDYSIRSRNLSPAVFKQSGLKKKIFIDLDMCMLSCYSRMSTLKKKSTLQP